jgi:hypothetical protein
MAEHNAHAGAVVQIEGTNIEGYKTLVPMIPDVDEFGGTVSAFDSLKVRHDVIGVNAVSPGDNSVNGLPLCAEYPDGTVIVKRFDCPNFFVTHFNLPC